ncbi:divalent-cation tolerance protein CutA [Actinocorallia lasiicapitis]
MGRYLEVRVTAASWEQAERIAEVVVGGRLAAGAQVSGPITSVYWWEGEVRRGEEFLVLMKTTSGRLEELVEVVRGVHSYEVPEIVAVPIEGGLGEYLGWITAETAVSLGDG